MNTTPKPSATKNSNGELVGPLELSLFELSVFVGDGELVVEVVVEGMIACSCLFRRNRWVLSDGAAAQLRGPQIER